MNACKKQDLGYCIDERDTAEKEVENKKQGGRGGKKLSKKTTKLQDSGPQEKDVIQAITTDTKLYNDILLFKVILTCCTNTLSTLGAATTTQRYTIEAQVRDHTSVTL